MAECSTEGCLNLCGLGYQRLLGLQPGCFLSSKAMACAPCMFSPSTEEAPALQQTLCHRSCRLLPAAAVQVSCTNDYGRHTAPPIVMTV